MQMSSAQTGLGKQTAVSKTAVLKHLKHAVECVRGCEDALFE